MAGNKGDFFVERRSRSRASAVRMGVRLEKFQLSLSDGKQRDFSLSRRDRLCGHERFSRSARFDGRGQGYEKYFPARASVRSVRRGERGVYSRKNLRRRGGRACLRNAVSLRYAECEDIFYRRCACDSDFARVRALSLADRVRRSEKKTYKIRRKRRRAPCGVSDVPHGTFGHCQLFLSDPRRSRTDIFSCLYS